MESLIVKQLVEASQVDKKPKTDNIETTCYNVESEEVNSVEEFYNFPKSFVQKKFKIRARPQPKKQKPVAKGKGPLTTCFTVESEEILGL